MKISPILFLLLCSFIHLKSQSKDRVNEIMLDPVLLLIGSHFNASYERYITPEASAGLNVLVEINPDRNFKQIAPFARAYFGKKQNSGFFLEAFIPISIRETDYYENSTEGISQWRERRNKTSVGGGIGAGSKWLLKDWLSVEISAGLARKFNRDHRYDEGVLMGKVMMGIGFRL